MIKDISFLSEGCRLAARLYYPENATAPVPCIVLCHGFAGVKELLLPRFAEYFCSRGFAVLAFDYRGFGGSEGTSGRILPFEQISDIRNAITSARCQPEIDPMRIGLWGSSYGGANAITAAAVDGRIRAVCAQITFADGADVVMGSMTAEEKTAFLGSLEKMWARQVSTGKEMLIPLEKMLSDPQSRGFVERYRAEFPEALSVKIPFLTIRDTIIHKPILYLPILKAALHLTVAENDGVNPPDGMKKLFAAAGEPKELFTVAGAGHYDVYEEPNIAEVMLHQADWFEKYL